MTPATSHRWRRVRPTVTAVMLLRRMLRRNLQSHIWAWMVVIATLAALASAAFLIHMHMSVATVPVWTSSLDSVYTVDNNAIWPSQGGTYDVTFKSEPGDHSMEYTLPSALPPAGSVLFMDSTGTLVWKCDDKNCLRPVAVP